MPYYRRVGDVPRKRHTLHRVDGAVAVRGADRRRRGSPARRRCSTTATRRARSCASTRCDAADAALTPEPAAGAAPPAHRRAAPPAATPSTGARPLLGNDDVRARRRDRDATGPARCTATPSATSSCTCSAARPCSRACSGACRRRRRLRGDPAGDDPPLGGRRRAAAELLVIEAQRPRDGPRPLPHADRPARSRARRSASATSALPDPEPLLVDGEDVPVLVRTRAGWSAHVHRHHPFDVVGWDGCLYPWAFSIHDFEPIVGRIHQPPPVHQTFAGPASSCAASCPGLFDFDPDAVKVPYHHANVDTDEVLFYSRRRLHEPGRVGHRRRLDQPAPGRASSTARSPAAASAATARTAPSELAVMIDTFRRCRSDRRGPRGQRPRLSVVVVAVTRRTRAHIAHRVTRGARHRRQDAPDPRPTTESRPDPVGPRPPASRADRRALTVTGPVVPDARMRQERPTRERQ